MTQMPRENGPLQELRVTWVIPRLSSGGIGPVCRYAAKSFAKLIGCQCTLLRLHEPPDVWVDDDSSVRFIGLGMSPEEPEMFMEWLRANPQDIIITNDVSLIECCFPFIPQGVTHIVQLHDSGRRYLDAAVRLQRFIDGVLCVARNIETKVRPRLEAAGFSGTIGSVCNGADFPPAPTRSVNTGPLRLLFMGSLDPMIKGVFDLVQIVERIKRIGVPVTLRIAGERNGELEARVRRQGLEREIKFLGKVPHDECYRLAAESDVFLMTSRREPFGMVTIEAMSMGCVPLAYDIPSGNREIIEHGKSGLLLPLGDFSAWASAVDSLHKNRHLLREMSEAAMVRARENFNSQRLATELADFIAGVQANSKLHPIQRKPGFAALCRQETPPLSYKRLPSRFRAWMRNLVGASPRLSFWLLNR